MPSSAPPKTHAKTIQLVAIELTACLRIRMHAAACFQPLPRSSPEPFQTLEYSRAGSRQMEVMSILPRYSRASALFLVRRATAAGR